ncbi:MAG: hypothetical protein ACE5HL_04335 [Terriglobia bacterium]
MTETQRIREALVSYRSLLEPLLPAQIKEAKVMKALPTFFEDAGFCGVWRWWRHWDLYWPPHSGLRLIGEVKGPASPEFNPDDSRAHIGYIYADVSGRVQPDQRGDGMAQLHLYCWELGVPYGLFTNGDRMIIYHHVEPFDERCFRAAAENCDFPSSKILDLKLLSDDTDAVVERLARALAGLASH